MKPLTLHYRVKTNGEESNQPRFWRCEADDYDHAVKQLKEFLESENEELVFIEHYK